MWIRYHIKCHTCSKVTNLRLQLVSQTEQEIKFECPNPKCASSLEAKSEINYPKFKNYKPSLCSRIVAFFKKNKDLEDFSKNFHQSLNFKVIRGIKFNGDYNSGDYFLEYSDNLPVGRASVTGHQKWTPLLRESPKKIIEASRNIQIRNFKSEDGWKDLIDLVKAYKIFNCDNIKTVIERIQVNDEMLNGIQYDYSSDLGHINAYFNVLNNFLFPWIDFERHGEFIQFLYDFMFSDENLKNSQLENLSIEYTNTAFLSKFNEDCCNLIIRFIELRDLFRNTFQDIEYIEPILPNPDFIKLKNFYTDCFEFIGRQSLISLKLMNLIERGDINLMPIGIPRNITTPEDFGGVDHGSKLDILAKCSTNIILEIFTDRFDSKLRNGINHNKANFNKTSQIISYYPITKRPNEEFQLSYSEFASKTLDIFESVLRTSQYIKMFHYYNRDKIICT